MRMRLSCTWLWETATMKQAQAKKLRARSGELEEDWIGIGWSALRRTSEIGKIRKRARSLSCNNATAASSTPRALIKVSAGLPTYPPGRDRTSSTFLSCEGKTDGSSTTQELSLGPPLHVSSYFKTTVFNNPSPRIVALDCEMVSVGVTKIKSALARCSVLDYSGNVLFNEYVCPPEKITDYRTRWSGIKSSHMKIAVPHCEAVKKIMALLEGCTIVGHALSNDFAVLGMSHQKTKVRDTACFVRLRAIAGLKVNSPPSLKKLAAILLGRTIQKGPHCSVEDARAALDIYRKFETVWEHELLGTDDWLSDDYWPHDIHN